MTKNEFKRIVSTFVASPDDIVVDHNTVCIGIDDSTIEVTLERGDNSNEQLYCVEDDGNRLEASQWIVKRLGKLDILAHSLLDKIKEDIYSIPVPGKYTSSDSEVSEATCDVLALLEEKIKKGKCGFATNVIYLTSDAGEGKTYIMNALARRQAKKFINQDSNWLFVPIALSGRPFLRLDEIIIGTLSNTYRFRSYYIETFLEMVRQGHIVLGLDGFEEMAIEGVEGDVVTSLGNLLEGLNSEGSLVFAARKAYYNYSNLRIQSRLFDAIRTKEVDFSDVQLLPWGASELVNLMKSFSFKEDEATGYCETFSKALRPTHVILTRAVLARRLVEELYQENGENIKQIIERFQHGEKQEIVSSFVGMLIDREMTKWVCRDEAATPLLTHDQHDAILREIAEEMWRTSTEFVRHDSLISIVELVCTEFGLSPTYVSQCKERIIHHALLAQQEGRRIYAFCHEEFYQYFLGKFIASCFTDEINEYQIRKIFDKKVLPMLAAEECSRLIRNVSRQDVAIKFIQEMLPKIHKTSLVNQNLGAILFPLLCSARECVEVKNLYCSTGVLDSGEIRNINFVGCEFENITLDPTRMNGLIFEACEIYNMTIYSDAKYLNITLARDSMPSSLRVKSGIDEILIYSPNGIVSALKANGIVTKGEAESDNESISHEDDDIVKLFFKIVYAFRRTTCITEHVLRTKTGKSWSLFETNVLEPMLENNVFAEVEFRGSGERQRLFRLNASFELLEKAHKECLGSGERLITFLKDQRLLPRR